MSFSRLEREEKQIQYRHNIDATQMQHDVIVQTLDQQTRYVIIFVETGMATLMILLLERYVIYEMSSLYV